MRRAPILVTLVVPLCLSSPRIAWASGPATSGASAARPSAKRGPADDPLAKLLGPPRARPRLDRMKRFRGVPFGADLAGRKGFHRVQGERGTLGYQRDGESRVLHGYPIAGVLYVSDGIGFTGAVIAVTGADRCAGLKQVFTRTYGKPTGAGPIRALWAGRLNAAGIIDLPKGCMVLLGTRRLIALVLLGRHPVPPGTGAARP